MKGSVVGFSFLTLFSVIVAVLAHMGIFMSMLLGNLADTNLMLVSLSFIIVAAINASIVYGLRRQRNWAIVLGIAEMFVLIIAAITNLALLGLSEMTSSFYWLIIAALFLWVLRNDYHEFSSQKESHV